MNDPILRPGAKSIFHVVTQPAISQTQLGISQTQPAVSRTQPKTTVGTLHATSQTQPATSPTQPTTSQQQPKTAVGTLHATSLQSETSLQSVKNEFMSIISPKPGALPTVIRSYKSAVSKHIHLIDPDFSWQSRYYDHLIRSDRELDRIRKYIIDNPVKWDNH